MKILLLSPVLPNRKSSGGILLCDLCNSIGDNSIYSFVARDPLLKEIVADEIPSIVEMEITKRPIESPYRFPRWFFDKHLSQFIEKLKNIYIQEILIRKAIKFGKKNKVDCILAILQGKTMIASALPIAQKLKVPLITQVWDDPSWILNDTLVDSKTKQDILDEFDKIIRASAICATASWAMAKIYEKKYKVKTTVLVASFDKKVARTPKKKPSNEYLTIGLAGQIYATDEWQSLLAALESVKWKVAGRGVTINLIGNFDYLKIPKGANVKKLGYMSQDRAIDELSKMDIGYCPYWFDKSHQDITKTSFPSKLTTYFAAGIPILFHGPDYASPSKFLKENNAGICCSSLDKEAIVKDLEEIITDKDKYFKLTANGSLTFKKFLTNEVFEKYVKELLSFDIEKAEL